MRKPKKRIARRTPPTRTSRLLPSKKAIPKQNKKVLRRKLKRYQAFMASAEWKVIRLAALERAGHCCEATTHAPDCERTVQLQVHHVRYTRFGGKELPSDLKVLSKPCHEAEHARKGGKMLWQRAS